MLTDPYYAKLYDIDPNESPVSPAWVIDLDLLEENLKILHEVGRASGAQILLALKGFASWATFPLVGQYLAGATASSPHEARLAKEELGKAVHGYAPAYSEQDFVSMASYCDHMVFNSPQQLRRFRNHSCLEGKSMSFGLRINPEHSEVDVALYDPCAPRSRLGTTAGALVAEDLDGIEGLHFHTLCELGFDALERTLRVVEDKFSKQLQQVKWVNFGGGHHITKPGYNTAALIDLILDFKKRHNVEVYLEPGEAIAIRTGILVTTVLDIIDNHGKTAILDCSATAHMPDVLEMPYRPEIAGAGEIGSHHFDYRLGGLTCLAGDVLGDYSFERELQVGQPPGNPRYESLYDRKDFQLQRCTAACARNQERRYLSAGERIWLRNLPRPFELTPSCRLAFTAPLLRCVSKQRLTDLLIKTLVEGQFPLLRVLKVIEALPGGLIRLLAA